MIRILSFLLFGCMTITCTAQVGNCNNPEFQFIFRGPGTNITIDCGIIQNSVLTPAVWIVGGDTCTMLTDTIWLSQQNCANSNNMTEVNIRMDKTGEAFLDSNDFIINNIYCGGTLTVTDTIPGDWAPLAGNSNVRTETYMVPCSYPSYLNIEITMGTDNPQGKLKIMSGGTCMNCFTPALLDLQSISLTANRYADYTQLHLQHDYPEPPLSLTVEHATDDWQFVEVAHTEALVEDGYLLTLSDEAAHIRYYRVTMLMPDGTQMYSPIAIVTSAKPSNPIYPNPVDKGGIVFLQLEEQKHTIISIYDVSGMLVYHTMTEGNTLVLPSDLNAGMYWIDTRQQSYPQVFPLMIR